MLFATAACKFSTSEQQKVLQTPYVLYILTSKCAFRHSSVQIFDIRTAKSAPNTSCFVHFDFEMCFSPQPCANFRHQNSKKCFKHLMFCAFSLRNVLFATAVCKFSTFMFCAFSLRNVCFATATCKFSTSELKKCSENVSF